MRKILKLGFIDKKLERRAPFPLVTSDKNAYELEVDVSKYPDAKTLLIYAKRADGEVVYNSVDITGVKVSYILKQGIYIVPGELIVRLVLKADDETILTAAEIYFDVHVGSCDGSEADDYETVEGFITELAQMREAVGNIDAALDEIISIQSSLMGVSE